MSGRPTAAGDADMVREALRQVIDPELGIDVVELGMIREIRFDVDTTIVFMVPTTMTCPFWGLFVDQVQTALADVDGVGDVDVRFDPREPWTPEMMSDEARWELEIQGLLPTRSFMA
jgi:metal-sulfur cluster biosynthetic enzyme